MNTLSFFSAHYEGAFMPTSIVFNFAVANANAVDPCDVLKFIQGETSDVSVYRRLPRMDGQPRADAFHWTVVLGSVGSVASIASLLWQAYDNFIAPRKTNEKSAGIIVQVTPSPGHPIQFWIGGTHNDREAFIAEFKDQVTPIQSLSSDSEYSRAVDHLMSESNLIPFDEINRDRSKP